MIFITDIIVKNESITGTCVKYQTNRMYVEENLETVWMIYSPLSAREHQAAQLTVLDRNEIWIRSVVRTVRLLIIFRIKSLALVGWGLASVDHFLQRLKHY